MCRALDLANSLFNITDEIKKEWEKLNENLKRAEQKRCDIYHYIEFSTLNAAQGYNAYRLLKEALEERRTIKNKMEEMKIALNFVNGTRLTSGEERQKTRYRITKAHDLNTVDIENKIYNVRTMTDLFGETM